jgi:hypothetical protein
MKNQASGATDTESNPKFLRCDLLRPADVILSVSASKEGTMISTMSHELGTDAWFSHAAIVIDKCLLFEAVDDGLIYSRLPVCLAGSVWPETVILHDVSHLKDVQVLRHPALQSVDPEPLQNRLLDMVQKLHGMEYPNRSRLAKAAAVTSVGRAVAAIGLTSIDKYKRLTNAERTPVIPGPFCSMLVAILLQALAPKHPLFNPKRAAVEVSPNSLQTESCLIPVKHAIVPDVPGLRNNPNFVDNLNRMATIQVGGVPVENAFAAVHGHEKRYVETRRNLKGIEDVAKRVQKWTQAIEPND